RNGPALRDAVHQRVDPEAVVGAGAADLSDYDPAVGDDTARRQPLAKPTDVDGVRAIRRHRPAQWVRLSLSEPAVHSSHARRHPPDADAEAMAGDGLHMLQLLPLRHWARLPAAGGPALQLLVLLSLLEGAASGQRRAGPRRAARIPVREAAGVRWLH